MLQDDWSNGAFAAELGLDRHDAEGSSTGSSSRRSPSHTAWLMNTRRAGSG